MKKLFLLVVLLLSVSFAFASNDVETDLTYDVEKTIQVLNSLEFSDAGFSIKTTNSLEAVGRCRIRIVNDETNEVVYDRVWLLGTAQECRDLAKSILASFAAA